MSASPYAPMASSPGASGLDPDLGDAMAQQLRRDRAAGNLASTHQALAASREGAWDRRWFYLSRIDASDPRALFDGYCAQAPQDPLGYLLRGAHGLAWAWEARGTGLASSVGQEASRVFLERLGAAEQDLRYAAQLDPADPTPYALLITAAKGLGRPREAMEQDFAAMVAREPEHLPGHLQKLQYLCAKWCGSHDLMFGFAREVSGRAQNGSDLHVLILVAHLEFRDALFREQNTHGGHSHLKVPATQTEINTAYARSYGTPMHQSRWWSFLGHNKFAYYFQLLPDPFRLKTELAAIGQAFDMHTWGADAFAAQNAIRQARSVAGGGQPGFTGASSPTGSSGSGFKPSSIFERLGVLNTIRLGCAVVGVLVAIGFGIFSFIQQKLSEHENLVYFVNASGETLRLEVDGQAPEPIAPGAYIERVYDPGSTHQVHTTADSGWSDQGSFTVPARAHAWSGGVRALYDLSGQGSYVSATVPYGTGASPSTVPIGVGQRFFLFPEEVSEYKEHFPNQISGNPITMRGVCLVDTNAGDVPCLR